MRHLSFILFVLLAGCAHGTYDPDNQPAPPEGVSELAVTVRGLSGLCYNKERTGFIAVSDKDGVFAINAAGTTATRIVDTAKDLEAVTIDPTTGEIYVAEERERRIYRLSRSTLQAFLDVTVTQSDPNKGLEGLTCDGNGNLLVGNQESPREIIKYTIGSKQQTARWTDTQLLSFKYISDLCWDATDGTLWVVDSKAQKVFHCHVTGTAITPFQYQSLAFMGSAAKPEALLVDSPLHVMWVGDDVSGKIYRIPLNMIAM